MVTIECYERHANDVERKKALDIAFCGYQHGMWTPSVSMTEEQDPPERDPVGGNTVVTAHWHSADLVVSLS